MSHFKPLESISSMAVVEEDRCHQNATSIPSWSRLAGIAPPIHHQNAWAHEHRTTDRESFPSVIRDQGSCVTYQHLCAMRHDELLKTDTAPIAVPPNFARLWAPLFIQIIRTQYGGRQCKSRHSSISYFIMLTSGVSRSTSSRLSPSSAVACSVSIFLP